jgi:nitrous oxidase accessory protein NosD
MKHIASALACAIALGGTASAATWHVANDGLDTNDCAQAISACRTITRAMELASPGDTVLVGPGRYGDLDQSGSYDGINEEAGMLVPNGGAGVIVNKPLTLLSTRGAGATFIDMGKTTESAVLISADGVRFGDRNAGFTITGGFNFGLSVQATNVFVTGNTVTGQTFGGFYLGSKGIIDARANTAVDNPGTGFILLQWTAPGYVQLSGNTARGNQTGIASGSIAAHRVTGNDVIGNENGILANYGASRFANNHIAGNRWGVQVNGYSHEPQQRGPLFTRNAFVGNFVTGITVYPGPEGVPVTLRENNFFGTTNGCGVLNLWAGTTLDARNNYWGAATGPSFADPADDACQWTAPIQSTPFATSAFVIP